MANENKNEKAGATTPATPSTVEGTQTTDQAALDLGVNTSANEVNENLKADLAAKDAEIESLKAEHQAFKDKLKPEIEKLQAENKNLKADLAKAGSKQSKSSKSDVSKFIVISAFRGTREGEGIFEIDTDVSHFDADRLKDLVTRELVKEVK